VLEYVENIIYLLHNKYSIIWNS